MLSLAPPLRTITMGHDRWRGENYGSHDLN
jgi:hypothetical protein